MPKETSSPEEGRGPQAKRSGKESLKARALKNAQKDEDNADDENKFCGAVGVVAYAKMKYFSQNSKKRP